jgi:L-ribulokinase
VPIDRVVCCGGIAEKNPLFMQIYADVIGQPMLVAGSPQTPALGPAISAAVTAGAPAGGYDDFDPGAGADDVAQGQGIHARPAARASTTSSTDLPGAARYFGGVAARAADLGTLMKRLLPQRRRDRDQAERRPLRPPHP